MAPLNLEGAFRIRAAAQKTSEAKTSAVAAAADPPANPNPPPQDPYFARLVKLVPSEVLALYLAFKTSAGTFVGYWALVCLGLVIVVRTLGTRQAGKPIQIAAVAIATVSYVLWIYATNGYLVNEHFAVPDAYNGIVSVAIGVWTFLLPYIYKGDPTDG
jgi:hypothetical protein